MAGGQGERRPGPRDASSQPASCGKGLAAPRSLTGAENRVPSPLPQLRPHAPAVVETKAAAETKAFCKHVACVSAQAPTGLNYPDGHPTAMHRLSVW